MEGDDKKALDVGCNGYIAKPIDTKNFLTTIGQFIQG
jgi:CheY-like chemotaxis protein